MNAYVPYGPADYDYAHAVIHERLVRNKTIQPRPGDPDEARWVSEGPKPTKELDTVRRGKK